MFDNSSPMTLKTQTTFKGLGLCFHAALLLTLASCGGGSGGSILVQSGAIPAIFSRQSP